MNSAVQAQRSPTPSLWRRTANERVGYAFILPMVLLFAAFRLWPAGHGLLLSFQDYSLVGGSEWLGLRHYRDLLQDRLFWHSLRVTATYALISVPLSTIVALSLALLINRTLTGISFYRSVYFLPYITSFIMVAIIWQWVYRGSDGLINSVLLSIGLPSVPWLTSQELVLPSLAIMATWKSVGYSMMILLAGLKGIPTTLIEASAVDGATSAQSFRRITLPLLRPVLFFVIVIETIGSFQVFDAIYVMTGGGPVRASYSLVYMLYNESFKFQNFGYAASIGIVLFLITFAVTMLQRLMFGRNPY